MVQKKDKKNQNTLLPEGLQGLGKLQPQALDLEEAVLGAVMLEKDAFSRVATMLKPSSFYKEAHQKIYEAVITLFNKLEPIDILSVTNQLRITGNLELVGGAFYIVGLTDKVNAAANIEYHAKVVAEQAIKRDLIAMASTLERLAYEDTSDVFDLINQVSRDIYQIERSYFSRETKSIMELSKEVMADVAKAAQKEDGITGEITGIEAIDDYTKGLGQQDFIVLGARPGMGKSSLIHSMIHKRAIEHKLGTALFSLEMSDKQVTKVLHAHQTGIDHEKLRTGRLEHHEWATYHQKIGPLLSAPIYIDDTPSISITEIRAKARRLVAKHDVTMIILDYIQLATDNNDRNKRNGNREQEISEISRGCKAMAKELNVPVIALAQLSREAEKRANKLPILADLRESGSLEQDADQVWFLFRPAYYNMDIDANGNAIPKHLTKWLIAKFREGETGEADLRFLGRIKQFDTMPAYDDGMDLPPTTNPFKNQKSSEFDDENPGF